MELLRRLATPGLGLQGLDKHGGLEGACPENGGDDRSLLSLAVLTRVSDTCSHRFPAALPVFRQFHGENARNARRAATTRHFLKLSG
jgi:hypothetical protein